MKLLGPWPISTPALPGREQAVIISMRLSNDDFGSAMEDDSLCKLEAALEIKLREAESGQWDGHETGNGYHRIFLYGSSAEKLSESILPIVLSYDALPGSYMVKRYGEIGSDEQYISLGSDSRA